MSAKVKENSEHRSDRCQKEKATMSDFKDEKEVTLFIQIVGDR